MAAVTNQEIAEAFEKIADLLEIEDANPFRVRAYRNAARTVTDLSRPLAAMVEEEADLTELPGIGEDLAAHIAEMVDTGHMRLLEEIELRTPESLVELTEVPGLGPKRVKTLYEELNVKTLDDLADAARAGKIHDIHGFGEKTEQHILDEVQRHFSAEQRITRARAEKAAVPLLDYLGRHEGIDQVVIAGSYRRCKETVGDLDILVTCADGASTIEHFVRYGRVENVVSKGTTRSTVTLRSGLQVDLRVVPDESFGAALAYFTGSKAHNIRIRKRGQERGLKINEYGVFKGDRRVAGCTEEEVYAKIGLPYIEPMLREDRGEIEAAEADKLPNLVTADDIRGDLHAHTNATDGRATLEAMAAAARDRGYDYLAITDHSQRVTMAHGLDAKRLAKQCEAIDRLNDKLDGIRLLKAIECDILEDGALDLPDDALAALDFTVCAVHYQFDLTAEKQTDRIIRAMDNPLFTILAHPTGRLLGRRRPYAVDMERLMKAAAGRGCVMEINSQPHRLDLSDHHCRMAKEIGVKLAISTDAHSESQLGNIRFGVDQGRRGWVEAEDVVNTRPLPQLLKLLKRS